MNKPMLKIIIGIIVILLILLLFGKVEPISNEISNEISNDNYGYDKTPIEELPENYTCQQAVEEDCVVRANSSQIYNTDILDEFLQKVKNNEPCFIRYIAFTIEGDMIITDVSFEGNDIFKVCRDSTRDRFSNQADRTYSYGTFTEIVVEELDGGVRVNLNGAIEGELQSIYIPGYEKDDEKINK